MTDLDQSVAQCRGSNVTDPHARKGRDTHKDKQDHTRLGSGGIQDSRGGHDVQSGLGQHGGDGETTNKEHDRGREHLRKDVPRFSLVVAWNIPYLWTYLVASAAGSLISASSDERSTLSNTTRNGTANDVTNSGIA